MTVQGERQPEPTPGPRRAAGRAGRDLPAAIFVSVVLAVIILASLFLVRWGFVALVVIAMLVALWELANALGSKEIRPPIVPLGLGTVAMLIAAYTGGTQALVVALALTALGVIVWRLTDGPVGYVRDMTAGVFTAVYVPFLAAFAVLLVDSPDGAKRGLTFFVCVACNDIGGYATGVLVGKHPMAPSISPKKSWEGFAGSVITCAVAGILTVVYLLEGPWWAGLLLGAATAVAATLGDLGESLIKRDLGIKDMGTLLPGHGGIMDRLDSLLLTAPVAWMLLSLLVPVAD